MKNKKLCNNCGEIKDVLEFYVGRREPDGRHSRCKTCCAKYDKEYRAKNLIRRREYNTMYLKSPAGRDNLYKGIKKYRETHPERTKAKSAVYRAIKSGVLLRPTFCVLCHADCKPHGHHTSYEEENRLTVVWVCKKCHTKIHSKQTEVGK